MLRFRGYKESDYDAVIRFLVEINKVGKAHINWNWARFEWMYEHSDFDKKLISSIGLWFDGAKVVGAAIYDMYFGEAFCGVLSGYEELYADVLDYAVKNLKDSDGLGIAIADGNEMELRAVQRAGFIKAEQTEVVLERALEDIPEKQLPIGLSLEELDVAKDAYSFEWLMWQGFDHGEDRSQFERTSSLRPRVFQNYNKRLSLAAVDEKGEKVGYCCLWYRNDTDYAYVEPVCTIPSWRGKGVAAALLTEGMRIAGELGARKAYVISDMDFYRRLGFKEQMKASFYWFK